METIYQRGGGTTREGGADFHAANSENLVPEWLIIAARESKEAADAAAKTYEEAAKETNRLSGEAVFDLSSERLKHHDERPIEVIQIEARSQVIKDNRDTEVGLTDTKPSSPHPITYIHALADDARKVA